MYKIYVYEQALMLMQSKKLKAKYDSDPSCLVAKYRGKKKFLLNYLDMMEKGSIYNKVVIHADDYEQLKSDFLSLYTVVPAGGGLVVNQKNQILFIYRRGFWDLPKGKIEVNEKMKDCAIREVEEETGIVDLKIISKLCKTHHQFKKGSARKIKESHWYLMSTSKQKLIPQTEEDITKAEWMTLEKFLSKERPVYKSILDVLKKYKKDQKRINKDLKKHRSIVAQ